MSLCTLEFRSQSIGKETAMRVILPKSGKGPFPVLYLLHGLSDDSSVWQRATRIEWRAGDLPLIVVMPDGARSFYINSAAGGAYEDFIVKDVVGIVDRTFPTIRQRTGRAISGLSMGGYGAMMLGLKHPEKFSVISAHSSAFGPSKLKIEDPDIQAYWGELSKREYNCKHLASAVKTGRRKMHIRFDCGKQDFLIGTNRHLHRHMERIGLEHEYDEFPGEHNWDYWEEHIPDTLRFTMKHLKRTK